MGMRAKPGMGSFHIPVVFFCGTIDNMWILVPDQEIASVGNLSADAGHPLRSMNRTRNIGQLAHDAIQFKGPWYCMFLL